MSKPLVSVIVPVYNKELYLSECINSILNQTYQNIELVLINDGSTDSSLNICQDFLQKDQRINLISISNGGAARARNVGILKSKGEYIMFVDGDDIVSPHMTEHLLNLLIKNGGEIAIGNVILFNEKSEKPAPTNQKTEKNLHSKDAIISFLSYQLSSSSCDKLIKRELFFNPNLEYPVGKIAEDQYIVPALFLRAKTICLSNQVVYNYRQAVTGSVTNGLNPKVLDVIDVRKKVVSEILKKYPDLSEQAEAYLVMTYIGLKETLEKSQSKLIELKSEINSKFGKNFFKIISNKYIPIRYKMIAFLLRFRLYNSIRNIL